ncbi:MAG TPA: helix-turn-helix transcriptional regulator [Clostridia bacterium]|nr:helix-turn-helix transcriptional regulator [Clostridia bacterium]
MLLQQIQVLCRKNQITIKQLEKEIGLGEGSIGKWKRSAPSAYSLKKIADFFGVTVDDLLTDSSAADQTA